MIKHPALIIGGTAVLLLISLAVEFIPFAGPVVGTILHGPLFGGAYVLLLKLIRDQRATFADIWGGFGPPFVNLMIGGILVQILGAIGLLLCIVPGVYLLVSWSFPWQLIVDKGMAFWPAMELSRKTALKLWWPLFALFVVSVLLIIAGFLVIGIGIFITAPLTLACYAYAYEDIFNAPPAPMPNADESSR